MLADSDDKIWMGENRQRCGEGSRLDAFQHKRHLCPRPIFPDGRVVDTSDIPVNLLRAQRDLERAQDDSEDDLCTDRTVSRYCATTDIEKHALISSWENLKPLDGAVI